MVSNRAKHLKDCAQNTPEKFTKFDSNSNFGFTLDYNGSAIGDMSKTVPLP